ncbi:MAG: hypothetical protein J6Z17_01885 [Treponema sp.]|jgi:hypothetical protein|nr:hypothetical protein [Treponema sp.]
MAAVTAGTVAYLFDLQEYEQQFLLYGAELGVRGAKTDSPLHTCMAYSMKLYVKNHGGH